MPTASAREANRNTKVKGRMHHIILIAAIALLGACTAGRPPANCVVTPMDLVECHEK
ncbi:hypothetical protein [Shinella sp.]|uniref:hypothetical protein n=1 Tax=Shinella sp. TaxID=1870904 RepID=UPI00258E06E3|nr:hypothetical protein [Shinella sp.]MCW5710028.1 hypothetical protein [Shinella sp.]